MLKEGNHTIFCFIKFKSEMPGQKTPIGFPRSSPPNEDSAQTLASIKCMQLPFQKNYEAKDKSDNQIDNRETEI